MSVKIDTVAARKSLPHRPAPYFQRLEIGGYIGFRKLADDTGTWVVRWRDDHNKQINKTLGSFDSYDLACKAAREWIEHAKGGVTEEITLEEACKRYVKDRRSEKGDSTASDADGRFKRLIYDTKIGKLKLASLKTAHLTDWRNGLIDIDIEDDDDPDAERRAKDSANRNLATLKAALNLSYRMGLVASTAQWDRVESFKNVGRRRDRFLTLAERKKLLLAAPADLQNFIKALLLTAARPGELANCRVSDLNKLGALTLNGKQGQRTVPISPDATKLLEMCSGARDDDSPLLIRLDGTAWTTSSWSDGIQEAREAAGLGSDVVAYTCRHVAITEMIVAGIDPLSVARLAGTSIAMIQSHYGHLMKDKVTDQLAKIKMI